MEARRKTQKEIIKLHVSVWGDRFYTYMVKREYSKNTIKTYDRYLRIFLRYTFQKGLNVDNMNQKEFDKFIQTIPGNTAKAAMQSTLRTFYKYMAREFGTVAPVIDMDFAKPSSKVQYVPSVKELQQLRTGVEDIKPLWLKLKANAILEIFLATGIREGELIDIRIKDIDTDMTTIKINGKGRKQRWVFLSKVASHALMAYLQTHSDPGQENHLFYGRKNYQFKSMSHGTVNNVFKRILKNAGMENGPKITAHSIRRAFATQLAENGVAIHAIRQLLGHSNIATTSRYINSSSESIKGQIEGMHPFQGGEMVKGSAISNGNNMEDNMNTTEIDISTPKMMEQIF